MRAHLSGLVATVLRAEIFGYSDWGQLIAVRLQGRLQK